MKPSSGLTKLLLPLDMVEFLPRLGDPLLNFPSRIMTATQQGNGAALPGAEHQGRKDGIRQIGLTNESIVTYLGDKFSV
jgi:hypothetical protein